MPPLPYFARESGLGLSKLPIAPLGKRRKQLACLVVLAGIVVSGAPIVSTSPQVDGRNFWSVCEIGLRIRDGRISLEDMPITLVVVYALLLIYLIAMMVPYSEKMLFAISVAGMTMSIGSMKWDRNAWELMFFGDLDVGSSTGRVGFRLLAFLLFAVMAGLFFISITKELDGAPRKPGAAS